MLSNDQFSILIVEDSPADQYLITDLLVTSRLFIKKLFYSGTIKEALGVLKTEAIDIVLLDLSLPDSYGINSYISVKEQTTAIPVIILSGYTDMKMALDAITQGAQDYLIKGDFDEKFLAKTILYSVERVKVEEKFKHAEELKQQEITEAVIAAQENERQEIGRELHDNINQVLASALLYLGLSKAKDPDINSYNKMADTLICTAIKEIRGLSHVLIAPSFRESLLQQAIEDILNTFAKTTGLIIHKKISGLLEIGMPDKFKLSIYRIMQEQLNNIQKYAHAKNIYVLLIRRDKEVLFSIKDDGIGFDVNKKSKGVGLMNIKARASLFNGYMNIVTSPGNGCELNVVFHT